MHLRKIKYFFKLIKFGRCCYMRTTEGLVAIVACLCHARMAQAFVGGGRIRLRQGAPPGGIGVVPQMAPRGMSLLAGSLRSTPRLSITMQERGGGDPGAPALERFCGVLPLNPEQRRNMGVSRGPWPAKRPPNPRLKLFALNPRTEEEHGRFVSSLASQKTLPDYNVVGASTHPTFDHLPL